MKYVALVSFLVLSVCRAEAQSVGFPGPGWRSATSTPPIVVTNQGTANNTSGATLALAGKTFSGSLAAVCVTEAASTLGTMSDGVNTYSAGPVSLNVGGSGYSVGIFFAPNAALASGTITYTKAGSAAASFAVLSATGISTTSPEDTAVRANTSATGNPPTISVATGTAAQTGELFVACTGSEQNGYSATTFYTQDATHSWVSPFSAVLSGAGGNIGTLTAGGNQVVAASGPVTFAPSIASGNGPRTWAVLITGFKHP